MRGKLLFVVGLGAGYVLGARAGRSAYDTLTAKLKGAASSAKDNPTVQRVVEQAEAKAPKATGIVGEVAATVGSAAAAAQAAGESDDEAPSEPASTDPASILPASTDPAASSGTDESLDESTSPTATA